MSKPKTTVRPHLFVPDPDVPPDTNGLGACAAQGCHLMGKPGDSRHTLPSAPDDVQRRAAGERED